MIVKAFTAPATLYKLKWDRNVFYVVGLVENQCATLKEDGSIHLDPVNPMGLLAPIR